MEPNNEPPIEGDALDHLWNAAHEMLRAMRQLLEAADEFVETQRARPARGAAEPREARVHRIDIDGRNDGAGGGASAARPRSDSDAHPGPSPDVRSDAS